MTLAKLRRIQKHLERLAPCFEWQSHSSKDAYQCGWSNGPAVLMGTFGLFGITLFGDGDIQVTCGTRVERMCFLHPENSVYGAKKTVENLLLEVNNL